MSELQGQSIFMGFTVSHQNSTDNNLFLSLSQYAEDGIIVLFRAFMKGLSDVVHYTHKLEENEGITMKISEGKSFQI